VKPIKENKYQEALDVLTAILVVDVNGKNKDLGMNRIETFKEIVDNYSELEKALDKACNTIAFGYRQGYPCRYNDYICCSKSKKCSVCIKEYLLKE